MRRIPRTRQGPIRFRIGLFLIFGFMASGCNFSPYGAISGPTAWIDAPLDGSQLPLAPVSIVLHAGSQKGIRKVEVTLNGQALADLSPQNAQDRLVNAQTTWSPNAPGTYVIEARAVDGSASAGDYASARIEINVSSTAAPHTVSQETPSATPTVTSSPTFTPTPSATLTGVSLTSVSLSDHQVLWGGGGCQPDAFTAKISVSDPGQVTAAIFFFRLEDAQTHELSGWSQGDAMNPQGGGVYQISRRGSDLEQSTRFAQAYVHYQFALQTSSGNISRSKVYSDLSLSQCSSGPVPTPTGILIVPPPGGIHIVTPTAPVIR
ncbi:MAG: Ig-like domain-containing protein [Anaerolineales bacterium]